jgi:hypothetical protein
LEVLAALRERVAEEHHKRVARRAMGRRLLTAPKSEDPPPVIEPAKQMIRLTERERAALVAHARGVEKFARLAEARRTVGSIGAGKNAGVSAIQEIVTETDRIQQKIQTILNSLEIESLVELFERAECLEKANYELYVFVAENDDLRRRLTDEITGFEREFADLSTSKDVRERTQHQIFDKLNMDVLQLREELKRLQLKKQQDAVDFSPVYAAIEDLFNALHCSWDDSPDGSMMVTSMNVIFALESIEGGITDMMAAMAASSHAT